MDLLGVFQWEFACLLPRTYYSHSWMATHASATVAFLKGRKSCRESHSVMAQHVKSGKQGERKRFGAIFVFVTRRPWQISAPRLTKGCFLGCGGAAFCHRLDGGGWTDSWCPDVEVVSHGWGLDQTCFEVSLFGKKIAFGNFNVRGNGPNPSNYSRLQSESVVLHWEPIQTSEGCGKQSQKLLFFFFFFPVSDIVANAISVQNGPLCMWPVLLTQGHGWMGWNKAIGMRNRWDMQLVKEAAL